MNPLWQTTYKLTLAGIGLAVVVVALGAYTRLADAGLGCPDWPGCYGFLTVPSGADVATAEARFPDAPVETAKAWWEMIHRYVAGMLGLLILAIAVSAVRVRPSGIPWKLPLALLALVCVQAAFGAWTVTLKLWPQVVTAHLLGGFATLSLLFLLALRLRSAAGSDLRLPAGLSRHALVALLVVVLQIGLGGWTSSNYAALACHDFPGCLPGEPWPEMDFSRGFDFAQSVGPNYLGGQLENPARHAIHMTHRLGALVVLAVVGALIWRLWRLGSGLAMPLAATLVVQIALGVANILWVLPLLNATAHNVVGALLLLVLVAVNYAAWRSARAAPLPSESGNFTRPAAA